MSVNPETAHSSPAGQVPADFQSLVQTLQAFWASHDCAIMQPLDLPMGAATFHPATFLRALGSSPWRAAYVQPCRRPADGRYGDNPNRLQHYYQFQVLLKPSPQDAQDLYLASLRALGVDMRLHDLRFVEDNWESPTLGAWGLGWEVWLDGMEVTQFTYFQQIGGLECRPVSVELTYGLERLAMYLQKVDNVFDLVWKQSADGPLRYGQLFRDNERQMSNYNFKAADIAALSEQFLHAEKACQTLCEQGLPLPAYEQVLSASQLFNLLDARRALSVSERQAHILRVRRLATAVAKVWTEQPEKA